MSASFFRELRDLARILSTRDVSTQSLVSKLGSHSVDLHGNVLVQEPSLAGVRQASVVRQVNSEDPSHVTLELDASIPLNELKAEFGDPKMVSPDHPRQPRSAVFTLAQADDEMDVRLIGEVRDEAVQRITLTREVRLA